jgi:hypothetical protein
MEAIMVLGEWQGTEIAYCYRDGEQYFDATAMCKSEGKAWSDYWRNASSKRFAAKVADTLQICRESVVDSSEGRLGGTWVHRLIAIDVAQWCSDDFKLWCILRIDELMTTGEVRMHREHQEAALQDTPAGQLLLKMDERLSRIEESIVVKRKPITNHVKELHDYVVDEGYNNRCPCCSEKFDDHKHRPVYDHHESRHKNGLKETWKICWNCNSRRESDQEFRVEKRPKFDAYQQTVDALKITNEVSVVKKPWRTPSPPKPIIPSKGQDSFL